MADWPRPVSEMQAKASCFPNMEVTMNKRTKTDQPQPVAEDQPKAIPDEQLDKSSGGSWFTCLKSCADSKGQVQGELARFR
jgi:hypothetical protein